MSSDGSPIPGDINDQWDASSGVAAWLLFNPEHTSDIPPEDTRDIERPTTYTAVGFDYSHDRVWSAWDFDELEDNYNVLDWTPGRTGQ